MSFLLAVIGFLTALLPMIEKLWPKPKTEAEKLSEVRDANEKFEETGNPDDLGKLP